MKLSKMQITGFGYLNNVTVTKNKSIIVINLKKDENSNEDIWLHCTACLEITNFVEKHLLEDLKNKRTVLIRFCAGYEKLSEAFYAMDNSNERIVVFNTKLETIESVYINGLYKSINQKQAVAV
jgi:hypothetical protein